MPAVLACSVALALSLFRHFPLSIPNASEPRFAGQKAKQSPRHPRLKYGFPCIPSLVFLALTPFLLRPTKDSEEPKRI